MAKATVPLMFHLDVNIFERLERFETEHHARGEKPPTRKAILTEALDTWLTKHGHPPKASAKKGK